MLQQTLIDFFQHVAKKDVSILSKISIEEYFTVGEGNWQFTLPDLHVFLQQNYDVFSTIDYKQFRKLIFSSKINSEIKPLGAEVTIFNNKNNVDLSTYELAWNNQQG